MEAIKTKVLILILILIIVFGRTSNSQVVFDPAFPALTFTAPVFLTHAYDGTNRIFVVQQDGFIKVFPNDSLANTSATFLNVSNKIIFGGERGLLGLAFHPNYETNRYFYIYYTRAGDGTLIISRFTTQSANPNKADSTSELILFTIAHPTYGNHNGGCLMFGQDNYLYLGTGDGGGAGDPFHNAQNTNVLLGKILRVDVDNPSGGNNYGIPPTNPFIGGGGRPEVFCFGMRNPWRFSQDPATGRIFCADVGQDCWEEIDTLRSGANYGWNIMEGYYCYMGTNPCNSTNCNMTGITLPIKTYQNVGSDCSITGGYVYRGSRVPWLVGRYVYGDYCSKKVWKILLSSGIVSDTSIIGSAPANILSYGVDQNNELYMCCANGIIYKFVNNVIGISGNSNNVPDGFMLEQNYPNPFNPVTHIRFQIPHLGSVKLAVYDINGREAELLVDSKLNPGEYEIEWDASKYSSGVYIYRLSSGDISLEKKMVLLK